MFCSWVFFPTCWGLSYVWSLSHTRFQVPTGFSVFHSPATRAGKTKIVFKSLLFFIFPQLQLRYSPDSEAGVFLANTSNRTTVASQYCPSSRSCSVLALVDFMKGCKVSGTRRQMSFERTAKTKKKQWIGWAGSTNNHANIKKVENVPAKEKGLGFNLVYLLSF